MEGYRQPDLHEIIGYGLREGGCLKGLIWLSLSQLISRREVLLVEFPSKCCCIENGAPGVSREFVGAHERREELRGEMLNSC
jgi:hypothetical protein